MPSVFVSFSFADRLLAEQVVGMLQARGIAAWLCTEELRAGDTFDAQIEEAIRTRDHGLLLLSPASAASKECLAEWRYMLSQPGHRLYVAQLLPTPLQAVSYRLRIYQQADLTRNFEAGVEALARAILAGTDLDPADSTTHRDTPVSGELPWWQAELPLVGRETELADLTRALTGRHRVLLTGGGGVGKTRLAVDAVLTAGFNDGVVWFRVPAAGSLADATRDVARLTDLLRSHLHLPANMPPAAVWESLGQVRLLLVLDNAEDCQYPQPYVLQLNNLATMGGTAVLLTSRYDWPELQRFHVLVLPVPTRSAASCIVQQLAGQVAGVALLTEAEATAMAEVGHDNPRLLAAAVPLLKTYPAAEVTIRLRALRGRPLEAATREIIDHTLDLLGRQPEGPEALAALRKLIACRGGFTLAAALVLLGPDVDVLETLRAWSLLRFDGWRYSLESLILNVMAPDEDSYPAFFTYYAELTLTLTEGEQYATLAPELLNLQVAFEWALRAGRVPNALGLAAQAGELLHNRGLFTLEHEWLRQVTAAHLPEASATFDTLLANTWGRYYMRQPLGDHRENLREGVAAFERALMHCSPETNRPQYASTQSNLGAAHVRWAELEQMSHHLALATVALREAARYGDSVTNPLGYATTQDNLGNAYRMMAVLAEPAENLDLAFEAYAEALDYRTPTTAPLGYAHTLGNLAIAYMLLATLEDYVTNMQIAAALFSEVLDYHTYELAPHAYAKAQFNMGTTQFKLGELAGDSLLLQQAFDSFTQALRVFTSAYYPQEYAKLQHNTGLLHQELAQYDGLDRQQQLLDAIAAYERALPWRPVATAPLLRGMTLHSLGTAYRALAMLSAPPELSHLRQAECFYEQALELRQNELPSYALTQDSLGNLYRDLAAVTGQRDYLTQSVEAFARALEVYTPADTPLDYARTRANRAWSYRDAGQVTEAVADWLAAAALYQRQGHEAQALRCRTLAHELGIRNV